MKTNERCILVIKMFTGEYLTQSENIGHEIINLFRADNGKHYIYAPWGGTLGADKDGKVTDILLVQNIGHNTLQILARINNIRGDQHISQHVHENRDKICARVAQYAVEQNVTYNGTPISDVFANNVFKNQKEDSSILFTFEVDPEQFRRPIKQMCLTSAEGKYSLQNTKIRQIAFYTKADGQDFNTLCAIIDDERLWEIENTTPFVKSNMSESRRTFLTLCRKEYDELVFSNLIAYYLEKNPRLLEDFVKNALELNLQTPFTIKCEYKHIDILIENADSAIIIENKIKSGVNGISADKRHSQLEEYIKTLNKERKLENIYGFVLCPNYNQIKISDYQNAGNQKYMARYFTKGGENIITYTKLFEFFNIYPIEDTYYADFLKALELHASNHDTYLEDLMYERFMKITTIK